MTHENRIIFEEKFNRALILSVTGFISLLVILKMM